MSETNRLQAQRPCANDPLFLHSPLKGGGVFVVQGFMGKHFAGHTAGWHGAKQGWGLNAMERMGLGGMQLPVLALSSGMWGGKAKGERIETAGWLECNGMKDALLRG